MTAILLCPHFSTAKFKANDDQSPLPGLSDGSLLPASNHRVPYDWKETTRDSSRDEDEAEEYYNPPVAKSACQEPRPAISSVESCVKSRERVRCGDRLVLSLTCNKSSFTDCHEATRKCGTRSCKPTYIYYPACGRTLIAACTCGCSWTPSWQIPWNKSKLVENEIKTGQCKGLKGLKAYLKCKDSTQILINKQVKHKINLEINSLETDSDWHCVVVIITCSSMWVYSCKNISSYIESELTLLPQRMISIKILPVTLTVR